MKKPIFEKSGLFFFAVLYPIYLGSSAASIARAIFLSGSDCGTPFRETFLSHPWIRRASASQCIRESIDVWGAVARGIKEIASPNTNVWISKVTTRT